MNNAEERMIKAKEMYDAVASGNEKLKDFIEVLNEMPERMEPLSDYYFNEWIEILQSWKKQIFTMKL